MPAPADKRVTRGKAFEVFVEMGPTRSIAGLRQRLVALGYKTSVNTLGEWSREDNWLGKITDPVTGQESPEAVLKAAVAWEMLGSPEAREGVHQVREALDNTALLVQQMAKVASLALSQFQPESYEQVLQMIRATGHLVEVTARVQEILSRTGEADGAKVIDATNAVAPNAGSAIAMFRRERG